MKPDFALSLSMEGIALMCRSETGWHLMGDVQLDHPNLGAALEDLRAEGRALVDGPLACKLVLPRDQIKYLQIAANDWDAETQVREALEGATPYEVSDLSYDFTELDDEFLIAAVAKETLQEAEEFALQHGFEPVCFVAIPQDDEFDGEPFFGATHCADKILGANTHPTPDFDPIEITGSGKPYEFAPLVASPVSNGAMATDVAPTFASIRQAKETLLAPVAQEPPVTPEPAHEQIDAPEAPVAPVPLSMADETPEAAETLQATPVIAEPEPVLAAPTAPDITPKDAPQPKPKRRLVAMPSFSAFKRPKPAAKEPDGTEHAASINPTELSAGLTAKPAVKPLKAFQPSAFFKRSAKKKRSKGDRAKRKLGALYAMALVSVSCAALLAWTSLPQITVGAGDFFASSQEDIQPASLNGEIGIDALAPSSEDTITDSAEIEALEDGVPVPTFTVTDQDIRDAEARYAATGIWDLPPLTTVAPVTDTLSQLYIGSFETPQITHDAIALPLADTLVATDLPLAPQFDPLPFGTEVAFDDRGLVVATPEGSLSPNWVMVFSGKPATVPASFPTRAVVAPDITTPQELEALRTELASYRPQLRPSDILEQNERSNLGGSTLSELAAIRPELRPEDPAFAAAAAVVASIDPNDLTSATELAVVTSLRPSMRPNGFAAKVEREQQRVASVAVPSAAATAPSIPTTASVARSATQTNAINLRRINLIGVYGTTSDRRALVRLVSGRYKKVQVGDSIDGGRVTAISATQLRYQKNGRTVVLDLPRG